MEQNRKTTIVASIGIIIFALIIVASVSVFSRGTETGRVSDIKESTRQGTGEELLRVLSKGVVPGGDCDNPKLGKEAKEVCNTFTQLE